MSNIGYLFPEFETSCADINILQHTTEIIIKCNECSFTGRTSKEVKEHKRTACSEALIQRIIEEDSERREDTDFIEEGSETSDHEEEAKPCVSQEKCQT